MATETSALRGEPQQRQTAGPATDTVAEEDYRSFSAALGASARGRAFLHEYAKRNRHADTDVVLAALDRLETVARSNRGAPEAERIRQDLRALLNTIQSARPQIESTPGAIKAATLSSLIDFVQARIEALVQPLNGPLASVPEPEQPELPIPQPGTAAQRTIALVEAIVPPAKTKIEPVPAPQIITATSPSAPTALGVGLFEPARSSKIMPEVNFIDSLFDEIDAKKKTEKKAEAVAVAAAPIAAKDVTAAVVPMAVPELVATAATAPEGETPVVISLAAVDVIAGAASPEQVYAEAAVAAEPSPHAINHALAAIMALSEEERLAMFT